MSNLELFLKKLSNSELAIFIGYRYGEFLSNSKEKIKAEVHRRKLSAENLSGLFNKGLNTEDNNEFKNNCPRCNSSRIIIENDKELKSISYASYEVMVETNRCLLCGYNPDKRKPKNILDAIKQKLFSNKNVRTAKPSERYFREF